MYVKEVDDNWKVEIPKEIREDLDIEEGDILEYKIKGNVIILTPKV